MYNVEIIAILEFGATTLITSATIKNKLVWFGFVDTIKDLSEILFKDSCITKVITTKGHYQTQADIKLFPPEVKMYIQISD